MTDIDTSKGRELLAGATEGPWERYGIRLNIRDVVDTDHAVALEREAIAAYLEAACPDGDGCFHDFIHAIRNGAHHPNTVTSGPGAGPGATNGPETTTETFPQGPARQNGENE